MSVTPDHRVTTRNGIVSAFDPYPNRATWSVALTLENTQRAHAELMAAAVKASYRLTGDQARKIAGDLKRYPGFFDPDDPDPINLGEVDWEHIARDWNETAAEQHAAETDVRLAGKMGKVLPVLDTITLRPPSEGCDHFVLTIPGQLPKDVYAAVDDVLTALGGRWNRKQRGHLFPADANPWPRIEEILATGGFQKPYDLGYFPTPRDVAMAVVTKAQINPGMRVLEPSIGQGHLADVVMQVVPGARLSGYELDPKRAQAIAQRYAVECGNFLDIEPTGDFDRVVMNPPFDKGQEVEHVLHAYDFLNDDGRLVAIMSGALQFRTDKRYAGLRTALAILGASIEENADSAFRSSGTDVHTITVVVDRKPRLDLRRLASAAAAGEVTADTSLAEARTVLQAREARRVAARATEQRTPALTP